MTTTAVSVADVDEFIAEMLEEHSDLITPEDPSLFDFVRASRDELKRRFPGSYQTVARKLVAAASELYKERVHAPDAPYPIEVLDVFNGFIDEHIGLIEVESSRYFEAAVDMSCGRSGLRGLAHGTPFGLRAYLDEVIADQQRELCKAGNPFDVLRALEEEHSDLLTVEDEAQTAFVAAVTRGMEARLGRPISGGEHKHLSWFCEAWADEHIFGDAE